MVTDFILRSTTIRIALGSKYQIGAARTESTTEEGQYSKHGEWLGVQTRESFKTPKRTDIILIYYPFLDTINLTVYVNQHHHK